MQDSTENNDKASFTVSGKDFIRARKDLKPAYPKKRQLSTAIVNVVAQSTTEISIRLPGASVRMPAIVSGPFTLQMPWIFFVQLTTTKFDDAATIQFQVCSGVFKYGEMATKSDQIVFIAEKMESQQPIGHLDGELNVEKPPQKIIEDGLISEIIEAPLGLPLLGAYSYMRKHGFRELLENKAFVAHQKEVVSILRKASHLLTPLGISCEDLEKLIDGRIGVSGTHPIDGSH
jgi:hypothetical protein